MIRNVGDPCRNENAASRSRFVRIIENS